MIETENGYLTELKSTPVTDVTDKFKDMIESFECDFSLAESDEHSLNDIDLTSEKIKNDIKLLCELSFGLRNGKLMILKTDNNNLNKWISVDERLPKVGENCLVYVGYSGFMGMHGFWIKTGHMEVDNDWWGDCMGGKVYYWQPLPKPPIINKEKNNS